MLGGVIVGRYFTGIAALQGGEFAGQGIGGGRFRAAARRA